MSSAASTMDSQKVARGLHTAIWRFDTSSRRRCLLPASHRSIGCKAPSPRQPSKDGLGAFPPPTRPRARIEDGPGLCLTGATPFPAEALLAWMIRVTSQRSPPLRCLTTPGAGPGLSPGSRTASLKTTELRPLKTAVISSWPARCCAEVAAIIFFPEIGARLQLASEAAAVDSGPVAIEKPPPLALMKPRPILGDARAGAQPPVAYLILQPRAGQGDRQSGTPQDPLSPWSRRFC